MSKTILITGGTGLIGRHLSRALLEQGNEVLILTRTLPFGKWKKDESSKTTLWGWEHHRMPEEAVLQADAVVHLAGANIFDTRWDKAGKKRIVESREWPSKALARILRKHGKKLQVYVSASGVGYYGGTTSQEIFPETAPPAKDFLGQTCHRWEAAADEVGQLNIRTVKLRTSVVLAKEGGALAKMLPTFRIGLGAPLGKGNQYFPWIHIDDLINIYLRALESEEIEGAYNASVQDHTTSKTFGESLAKVLHRPYFLPAIPASLLHLVLGERAVLLLEGSRVSNEKIKTTGFTFQHENLTQALNHLLLQ